VSEPNVITAETEEITLTEGVEIVQLVRPGRPYPPDPFPGPARRVMAAAPDRGQGSRPRR
jgi:hypothetical protein